jgi:hypothetical protein
MNLYVILPFIIIFNTYVCIKRSNDIYQIITSLNFDIINSIYILLFTILNLYTLLVIYSITKTLLKYIEKNNFNIDNKITMINFIDIKEDEDKICPICYDDLKENICKLIQCRHIYHKMCIKEWYKISGHFICPNCRKIA